VKEASPREYPCSPPARLTGFARETKVLAAFRPGDGDDIRTLSPPPHVAGIENARCSLSEQQGQEELALPQGIQYPKHIPKRWPVDRMRENRSVRTRAFIAGVFVVLNVFVELAAAQVASEGVSTQSPVVLLEMEGVVRVSPDGGQNWFRGETNQILKPGFMLRTEQNSRATLRLLDFSLMRVGQLSDFQVQSAAGEKPAVVYRLLKGIVYFFHRDKPAQVRFETPTVSAAIRGTEFNLQVMDNGQTILTLLEGEVGLSSAKGSIVLTNREQGIVELGQAPRKSPVLETVNIIQWCLYYPAVLDVGEVEFSQEEQRTLADSLRAYRSGDLLDALAKYPAGRAPASGEEKVYRAALLLAVGQVELAEELLKSVLEGNRDGRPGILATAIRKLISAVRGQTDAPTLKPELATSLLAESYHEQSWGHLENALETARQAVVKSGQFGFGWARVAELEFSFGRVKPALAALEEGLQLAPRNAQALALKGFVLSAQNRITEALSQFDQAIAVDGALGNAWLGRGLCKIRRGQAEAGREDLQMAVTLEPQRALPRSYLGKAFSNAHDNQRAGHELELAKRLDEHDPTAWLYSALLEEQNNQINQSVRDLEKSQELNENRRVYRSRLLLDQDRAVRGANLANIYLDAGMTDVSAREASRAVDADYANYSAHLFLANSFNALRDPRQVNLRYETPWLTEYLVANLLAPVGVETLSQMVSQQEYSRLFQRDRLGFSSSTEYFSRGDWVQSAVQYGTYGDSSYAAEVNYRSETGHRPNNDLEQLTTSIKLKQQITQQDDVYLQAVYYNAESGDVAQYYDESRAHLALRVKESQEPILLAGYHRAWAPGSHTLFLASYFQDTFKLTDTNQTMLVQYVDPAGGQVTGLPYPFLPQASLDYRTDFQGYSAELQHIWQVKANSLVGGLRYQGGTFDTRNQIGQFEFSGFANASFTNATVGPIRVDQQSADVAMNFQRLSFYGYDDWQVFEPLLLTAGVSYDRLYYPLNFRNPPIGGGQESTDLVSPKAGLIWTPLRSTTVRAAYSRALGGVSFDQSVRLEPSQIAGFNQAFRSLIPESVAGAIAGAKFEIFGLALDQQFSSGTYFGAQGEMLRSDVNRSVGTVNFKDVFPITPASFSTSHTGERLEFEEHNLVLTLRQLVEQEWTLGASYRLSHAQLTDEFRDLPATVLRDAKTDRRAILDQVDLFAIFNHASGFFSQFETIWSQQSNRGYTPNIPGDDFWQFNVFAGYRFPRRQTEVKVGLLNITDRNYKLNPLNLTSELPRERTLFVSLRLNF
jgi:Tfp pilus assembly protein PilF